MNAITVKELESDACSYWPTALAQEVAQTSVLIPLLETQDVFLSVLKCANKEPFAWRDALRLSKDLSPNLFLKHLMVLTDVGGERLQRFGRDFDKIFPEKKLVFQFGEKQAVHHFSPSKKRVWKNKELHVEKSLLLESLDDFTQDMLDVCTLLIWGACAIDPSRIPDEILEKCVIGNLIGRPKELDDYVRQRYLHVSRQSGGSTANDLGYACEAYVKKKLKEHLSRNYSLDGHTMPNVSQTDDGRLTKFDLVVVNVRTKRCIGIEISFQVTTNSVIERKSQNANNRQTLAHAHGHKVAYIIDGSGNFERKSAIEKIIQYSDCTVNFSDAGLARLARYIKLKI
jgi:hypothetical protein